LTNKDFTGFGNQALDFRFEEVDLFARLGTLDTEEFFEDLVNINLGAFVATLSVLHA